MSNSVGRLRHGDLFPALPGHGGCPWKRKTTTATTSGDGGGSNNGEMDERGCTNGGVGQGISAASVQRVGGVDMVVDRWWADDSRQRKQLKPIFNSISIVVHVTQHVYLWNISID